MLNRAGDSKGRLMPPALAWLAAAKGSTTASQCPSDTSRDALADSFHALRDFVSTHPEAALILRAID